METIEGMRPVTLEDLQFAQYHQEFVYIGKHNSSGRFPRVRVNGAPKLWKRNPDAVRVPYKYGLYEYGYLTQDDIRTNLWFTTAPALDNRSMRPVIPMLIEV